MHKIGYDIVVKDSEAEEMQLLVKKFFEDFDERLAKYTTSLETIINNGIKSGSVNTNLSKFKDSVEQLESHSENLNQRTQKVIIDFLADFDEADGSFY
ncbi:hypothetical protein I6N96_02130 [Enterococcus sp. BWM-S5]|uniref:LXG domain-containing protein n=1 Tax=Enterococcus larvae TaxID=2794352 RepID=A0ABS4CEW3_9ENTE|nr:hypothetical protein [Enterococcus larvae]MBP1045062.1 hypothetical protein [Enterococcus larvae]